MKILLTSAGITSAAIADGLQKLVAKPLTETKLIFIPTAANLGVEDKSWLVDNIVEFRDQHFASFDIVDIAGLPDRVWLPHFEAADVICFGGGDETYLSRILDEQGVKEKLLPLLETRVYMGISAGSMVAGASLPRGLSPELFGEDDYESDQGNGMELYDFTFIPHLNSNYFNKVRVEYLETCIDRLPTTCYATDDFTAISLMNGQPEIVGEGAVWRLER